MLALNLFANLPHTLTGNFVKTGDDFSPLHRPARPRENQIAIRFRFVNGFFKTSKFWVCPKKAGYRPMWSSRFAMLRKRLISKDGAVRV